jgi:amino acid transporter
VRTQSPAAVNWRQGQNLFMALAIVALLVLVLPLTLSGYATYNEWGDVLGDWVSDVHAFFGDAILAVVLAHLAAIAGLSVLRHKNLPMQMVSGRVPGPGPDLVKRNHLAVGVLLLSAVLTYWTWEWQQSPQGLLSVSSISAALRDHGGDDD